MLDIADFALLDVVFLYSCKYSQALFWDPAKLLGSSLVLWSMTRAMLDQGLLLRQDLSVYSPQCPVNRKAFPSG